MLLKMLIRLLQDGRETITTLYNRNFKVFAVVLNTQFTANDLICVLTRYDKTTARVYDAIKETRKARKALLEIDSSRLFFVVPKNVLTSRRIEKLKDIIDSVIDGHCDDQAVNSYPVFVFEQSIPNDCLSRCIRITITEGEFISMQNHSASFERIGLGDVSEGDLCAVKDLSQVAMDDDELYIMAAITLFKGAMERRGLACLYDALKNRMERRVLAEALFSNIRVCGWLFWRGTGIWMDRHKHCLIPEMKKSELNRQQLKSVIVESEDSFFVGADVYKCITRSSIRVYTPSFVKQALVNEELLICNPEGNYQTYVYLSGKEGGWAYRLRKERFDFEVE